MTAKAWLLAMLVTLVPAVAVAQDAPAAINAEAQSRLIDAIYAGQTDQIVDAVLAGADVNGLSETGQTPLSFAATQGNCAVLKLLLLLGADPDLKDSDGSFPLIEAVSAYDPEAVCLLVEHGAYVDKRWDGDQTALAWTVTNRRNNAFLHSEVYEKFTEDTALEIAGILLSAGARANPYEIDYSLVHRAVMYKSPRLAFMLLEAGGIPSRDSIDDMPTLHWAIKYGNLELIEPLVAAGESPNIEDVRFGPALNYAASTGREAIALRLLDLGADPFSQSAFGESALAQAAGNGLLKLCQRLIEAGVDPTAVTKNGVTPLHCACEAAQFHNYKTPQEVNPSWADVYALIELLLRHGADPNAMFSQDASGSTLPLGMQTPLHIIAYYGEPDAVSLLYRYGAKLDPVNPDGSTPLEIAAYCHNDTIYQRLVELGAQPGLSCAACYNDLGLLEQLLSQGVEVDTRYGYGRTALGVACYLNNEPAARLLLEHGADPNATDDQGESPLYYCARKEKFGIARLLVGSGANPEFTTSGGYTPLHQFASAGDLPNLVWLLRQIRNLDSQDRWGNTPLYYAAQEGKVKNVEVLLWSGADPNLQNDDGKTPLHLTPADYYDQALALLETGADPLIKDNKGHPALSLDRAYLLDEERRKVLEGYLDRAQRAAASARPGE